MHLWHRMTELSNMGPVCPGRWRDRTCDPTIDSPAHCYSANPSIRLHPLVWVLSYNVKFFSFFSSIFDIMKLVELLGIYCGMIFSCQFLLWCPLPNTTSFQSSLCSFVNTTSFLSSLCFFINTTSFQSSLCSFCKHYIFSEFTIFLCKHYIFS